MRTLNVKPLSAQTAGGARQEVQKTGTDSPKRRPTAIDLFAGAGGLTLGLHRAGFELLFAVEKDRMAFETFSHNFLREEAKWRSGERWPDWLPQGPHEIVEFLAQPEYREALSALEGQVDLVCGGPPCQGFSVGGARNGEDQRNMLPLQYIEFVRLVKPKAVLLENVEGMARPFKSRPGDMQMSYADWFKSELQASGYDVHYTVLDASETGVPQTRRRLFLYGISETYAEQVRAQGLFQLLPHVAAGMVEAYGLPSGRPVTVSEALDDLDGTNQVPTPDSPRYLSGTYKKPASAYAQLMRDGLPDEAIPDSHRFSFHTPRMQEFLGLVHETQPYGRLSRDFLRQVGTRKQKKVFLDPAMPASTITTHPDEFIHYRVPRIITVREMARLQSFPDTFEFKGRYTINGDRRRFDAARVSQVGNAVPPLLAEALGRAMVLQWRHVEGTLGADESETLRRSGASTHQEALFASSP